MSETPSFLISERLGDEERVVVNKGTLPHLDSYSSFFDNARLHETHLDSILKGKGITNVCFHSFVGLENSDFLLIFHSFRSMWLD